MGPAKPTRILSEAERKALLEQASPVSSIGTESHQKLFLETSFANSNVDKDSLNNTTLGLDSPGYQERISPNNCVTWNDLIVQNENYNNTCEIPLGAHPLDAKCIRAGPNFSLDLGTGWSNPLQDRESEREPAPLASPEALSETSSLASFVSRSCSLRDSQYRLANEFPRLDRIAQSPQDTNKPITSHAPPKRQLKSSLTERSRGVRFSAERQHDASLENIHEKKEVKIAPVSDNIPNRHGWQEASPPKVTQFLETSLSQDDICEATKVTPVESEPVHSKCKLTLMVDDKVSGGDSDVSPDSGRASSSGGYQRHSPVECSQHEYAQYIGYYSPAGRGYPHGAYHPPDRHSLSPSEGQPRPGQIVHSGIDVWPTSPNRRARICAARCTPVPSNQTSSPEEDYDKRLSAHSDEVFEFPLPLQQTDV